ncbi:uncharacterized protein ARMOST_21397 [Armillaria ostoyae]|uniref:Uncharacterized protein n=1 Tax=Armillaria ostoyae TaxID=47428 RepID=A0A284S9Z7_ARMOS|nr:uncharacterized protein ARMOST_21397 [Armillaria ostoyae]
MLIAVRTVTICIVEWVADHDRTERCSMDDKDTIIIAWALYLQSAFPCQHKIHPLQRLYFYEQRTLARITNVAIGPLPENAPLLNTTPSVSTRARKIKKREKYGGLGPSMRQLDAHPSKTRPGTVSEALDRYRYLIPAGVP